MTVMIDWLTATIQTPPPLKHIYNSGFKRIVDHNGEVLRDEQSPLDVRQDDPSHSRNFRVSTPREDILRISGNPSKLLQGHNLFGCDDVNGYYLESGLFIRDAVGMFPSPDTYESLSFTKPSYSRLDITKSYRCQDAKNVPVYIREVVGSARSRSGRATLHGSETAYFNKGSRRWSLKVYDKHQELLKRLPRGFLMDSVTSDLLEWSKGVIRFELVLRGQELDSVNELLRLGTKPDFEDIFNTYFNRIQFNENLAMKKVDTIMEQSLKPNQKAVINQWRAGIDLRTVYPKNTFYRHRRNILALVGLDIASSPSDSDDSKEIDSELDPSGWNPEPIEAYLVKPREDIKKAYKLP